MTKKGSAKIALTVLPIAALALSSCGSEGGSEQGYPDDTITWVVPFGAGGNTDSMARVVAESMSADLDVEVVVENHEGGSGSVGSQQVQSADADGYTVGLFTTGSLVVTPTINELDYNYESFDNIGLIARQPVVIMTNPQSEYETFEDLTTDAQNNPEEVTIGVPGATSPQAFEIQRMQQEYDTEFGLVPFDSTPEVVNALLGGNVDAVALNATEDVIAQIDSGEVSAVAVGEPDRLDWLEDVPTLAEEGYENLTDSGTMIGFYAPEGLPDNVQGTLEEALENALQDEDVRETIGSESVTEEFVGSEELKDLLSDRTELYETFQ